MPGMTIDVWTKGIHKSSDGRQYQFTQHDLEMLADNYDPLNAPAPVVIGHPKNDAPAYAWVETLFLEDGKLRALLKDIDPEFANLLKAGRYKRISPAFFPKAANNNPKPGNYYLRHVGFLGAAAPANNHLRPVEFVADSEEWVAFSNMSAAEELAQFKRVTRLSDNYRFVEKLIDEGKILPCQENEVIAFMASLDDSADLAFCDGHAAQSQSNWFKGYLSAMPPLVPMGRVAASCTGDMDDVQFAAPEGYKVDRGGLDLHAKATHIMREKGVSFEDALEFVHGD